MRRPIVLICNASYFSEKAIRRLAERFEIVLKDNVRAEELTFLGGVDAICWATDQCLDRKIIKAAGSRLKVVSSVTTGMDHIDVKMLKDLGVLVTNTPSLVSDAVADMAVMLLLAACRRLGSAKECLTRNDRIAVKLEMMGCDLKDSTVGVVGLGAIGQKVVQRLKPFGVANFLYTGPKEKPEARVLGVRYVSLEDLIADSDFVILCCPLTAETVNLIGEQQLAAMKRNCVLVNVARGQVVDQSALVRYLEKGWIFGAALDVTTPEPLPEGHKLLSLPNCILTPHVGSSTHRSKEDSCLNAIRNIEAAMDRLPVPNPV